MRRLLRFCLRLIMIPILILALSAAGGYGYVRLKMHQYQMPYTETVEQILMDLVPEEGIEVKGRTYSKGSVYNFLEEIRYDPYNYVHKDHHCILRYMEERDIRRVISALRFLLQA